MLIVCWWGQQEYILLCSFCMIKRSALIEVFGSFNGSGYKSATARNSGGKNTPFVQIYSSTNHPLTETSVRRRWPLINPENRAEYSCVKPLEPAAKHDAFQEHNCTTKSLQMNTVWEKKCFSSPGGVHLCQHRWWMPTCKWAPLVWEEESVHHGLMCLRLIQLGSTQPEQALFFLQTGVLGWADLSGRPSLS